MSKWTSPVEPTLDDVRREFGWDCWRDTSGLYYARMPGADDIAEGEDPLDLRDMIIAAKWRAAFRTQT